MPSAWIEHIKAFAKANDMSYKDALKCPKCKEEYHKGKGKGVEAPAEKENISMEISEKKPRGRPKKYATEEERKKAKSAKTIESNKRKKAEGKGAGLRQELSKATKASEALAQSMKGKGFLLDHLKAIFTGKGSVKDYTLFILSKVALYLLHKYSKKQLEERYGIRGSWFPVLKLLSLRAREAFGLHPAIVRDIARVAVGLPAEEVNEIEEGVEGAGMKGGSGRSAGGARRERSETPPSTPPPSTPPPSTPPPSTPPNQPRTTPPSAGRPRRRRRTDSPPSQAFAPPSFRPYRFPSPVPSPTPTPETTPPSSPEAVEDSEDEEERYLEYLSKQAISIYRMRNPRKAQFWLNRLLKTPTRPEISFEELYNILLNYWDDEDDEDITGDEIERIEQILRKLRDIYNGVLIDSGAESSDSSSGEGAGLVPSGEETKKKILDSVAYYTDPKMKALEEAFKKQSKALKGKGLKEAIAKNAEYKEKVLEALPAPIKRKVRQARETTKLLADNKAKILAEDMKTGSYGGGLIAGYKAEDAGGLTHIYPLSHAHILEMCKHLI